MSDYNDPQEAAEFARDSDWVKVTKGKDGYLYQRLFVFEGADIFEIISGLEQARRETSVVEELDDDD